MKKETLIHAGLGAVGTIVLSFTMFSPVLGGAIAGYLEGDTGARIGALSGLLASVFLLPLTLIFVFILAGGFDLTILALVLPLIVILVTTGMSALGGLIGVYVVTETQLGSDPT